MFWNSKKPEEKKVNEEEIAQKNKDLTDRLDHKCNQYESQYNEIQIKLKEKMREYKSASGFNRKMIENQLKAMLAKKKQLESQLTHIQRSNMQMQGLQNQME